MIDAILLSCAPNVHPATIEAVIKVESGGNPLAVHINDYQGSRLLPPKTATEAVERAQNFIRMGFRVDLGLMQITDRNLQALGYTIEQVFDPCTNIAAGGRILTANYVGAVRQVGEGQTALLMALSAYNTGSYDRGFSNGYVARYAARYAVPALSGAAPIPPRVSQGHAVLTTPARAARPNPLTADTTVAWGPGEPDAGESW